MQAEATAETAEKIVNEVLVRVDALAAKLGTTVEALWPAMVAYERSSALGAILSHGIIVAALLLSLRWATSKDAWKKNPRYPNLDCYDPTFAGVIRVVASVGLCLALIALALHVPIIAGTITSPEAAALKSLLGK